MVELRGSHKNDDSPAKPSSVSPFLENQVYFATCSPKKTRNSIKMKKRHYNVSPDGVSSLDEYTTTTITYDTHTPSGGRRMSITISDGNSNHGSEISSEKVVIPESSHETSSLMTQSTNCSRTTSSPLPSPSSGLSLASTITCKPHRLFHKLFTELCSHTSSRQLDGVETVASQPTEEFVPKDRRRSCGRRHLVSGEPSR